MKEVAEGIHRLGARLVSWYLIESRGRFTVVDAGNPNQYEQLPKALASLGKSMTHVDAVVLTHAHGDHLGSSVRMKHESDAEVLVHLADEQLALGRDSHKSEQGYLRHAFRPFAWRSLLFFMLGGAAKAVPHVGVSTFGHGEMLDVPGSPRVIHTPGHTEGSACIFLEDRNVVFTGDALVTLDVMTGATGPRLMPASFNKDSAKASESLAVLAGVMAETVLPGHGEPWRGSLGEAIAAARAAGAS
jgi:glyoxylase-like metal-dependent hydrolase (beta-lactamase superfamily II)